MDELSTRTVKILIDGFKEIESQIPPPVRVPSGDSFVFRYPENGIREAIVQKLSRIVSGLQATQGLVDAGFLQEAGVLYRTLDEIFEDIAFLSTAITENKITEKHEKFLKAFNSNAIFSSEEGSLKIPKPNMLARKKVRAQTLNTFDSVPNGSNALIASESVSTAFSGYVHAASENIMETYGGNPPGFSVEGMKDTPRQNEFQGQQVNFMYKGIMGLIFAAKAFGNREVGEQLLKLMEEYEATYSGIV